MSVEIQEKKDDVMATVYPKLILPKNSTLLKEELDNVSFIPSTFFNMISMTTKQRLANTHTVKTPQKIQPIDMSENSYQKVSGVCIDQPLFQPYPSEIFFQQYEPFKTYKVPLIMKNNDKVPRLIKVQLDDSPYFKIISPVLASHNVAPGLSITFKIQFIPEENKDYNHEIICVSQREKYVIPIRAIGARAILDFPDDIHFPVCPVKLTSTKTILVTNLGNREAKFSLETKRPFNVSPSLGNVKIYENCQVNVEFFPQKVGNFQGDLILQYDTGESIHIALHAVAEDVNIRLDKNTIHIENTFISLANQRNIRIHNRSNTIANYKWSKFETCAEEEEEKNRMLSKIEEEKIMDTEKLKQEYIDDPTLRNNLSVLNRSYQNKQKLIEDSKGTFIDDVIKIEPVEGEIWPNSSREITVIFKPLEAKAYKRTAFCEITGREIRIPLRILGYGKGPELQFSINCMDLGPIFIGSCHHFEVVLANKGEIDATYKVQTKDSAFGMSFNFDPEEGRIERKGYQVIHITFKGSCLGDYNEIFSFNVDGLPDPLQIEFRGSVIGPTFHFDVTQLDFGTVSYGFLYRKKFKLHNTSFVSMNFRLHVLGDGIVNSIDSSSIEVQPRQTNNSLPPKEFEIIPATGSVDALSSIDLVINFIPNSVIRHEMVLVVDVIGVADQVLFLPIVARCLVPKVVISTPMIEFAQCFLFHPYTQSVKLENVSNLPARYDLLKQDATDIFLVTYSSTNPSGIIQPFSSVDVPLTIEVKELQKLTTPVQFQIFGNPVPITAEISCFGEGPVVEVTQLEVDWGAIPVLIDSTRELTLLNKSPIVAYFSAQMSQPCSVFRVFPNNDSIPPEGKLSLLITANLNDSIRFDDKVKIEFEGSSNYNICVSALGKGSTIVADPPLSSILDLGPHFSNQLLCKKFVFTNKGRRHQQVNWVPQAASTSILPKINSTGFMNKNKKDDNSLTKSNSIFHFLPHRFKLMPGETIPVDLIGFIETPTKVNEELYCYSIIGKQGGKKLLMKVNVQALFINPLLSFSSTNIVFRVDKTPELELENQYHEFVLTNATVLPLTVSCSLPEPFRIEYDGQVLSEITLPINVNVACKLMIIFDPCYKDDLYSRTIDKVLNISYTEHPHVDYISLRGEVYMPNLTFSVMQLDFSCIMNNKRETKYINILNDSPMSLDFKWKIVELEQSKISNKLVSRSSRRKSEENATAPEIVQGKRPALNSPTSLEEETNELINKSNIDVEPSETTISEFGLDELPSHELGQVYFVKLGNLHKISNRTGVVCSHFVSNDWVDSFNLFPMNGTLKPGESGQVQVTFFGHTQMKAHMVAVCDVEGGPNYHIPIKGKASQLSYEFNTKVINYGKQRYDQVAEAMITLNNTSLVGFDFYAIDCDCNETNKIIPGTPIVVPSSGYIKAGENKVLTVKYMPGIPEEFSSSFSIQITHFKHEVIKLLGVGTFPYMSLDLPRFDIGDGFYNQVMEMAKKNLLKVTNIACVTGKEDILKKDQETFQTSSEYSDNKEELEKEIDRLAVMLYATNKENECYFASDLLEKPEFVHDQSMSSISAIGPARNQRDSIKKWKARPRLPSYELDFGFVVLGVIRTQTVTIKNYGHEPLSFKIEHNHLAAWGFKVDLAHVKQLPPDETVSFNVTFNPRGADLLLGAVETMILINIVNGPQVVVRLSAKVTMPDLTVMDNLLEFGNVKCGECKMFTVQLYNHQQVPCEWSSVPPETRKKEPSNENVPSKKLKTNLPYMKNFEILPSSGVLVPEQRLNVQVKFMPTEEKVYEGRITIRLNQSCNRVMLVCKGKGLEQKLIFMEEMINYGPILPYSCGDEKEVIVKNPCDFPIEFYSADFDTHYLEEEKILRLMRGYDEFNTLLLPPRAAGEKLPHELSDFYKEHKQKLEEMEKIHQEPGNTVLSSLTEDVLAEPNSREGQESDQEETDMKGDLAESFENLMELTLPSGKDDASHTDIDDPAFKFHSLFYDMETDKSKEDTVSPGVGELEDTPVSAAIARYLGMDLSPEGQAARNRRGVAIIVYGSPLSGKTRTSSELAKMYDAALLTVDDIVTEAILNGVSPASVKAHKLCAEAAQRKRDELIEEQEANAGSLQDVSIPPAQAPVANALSAVTHNTAPRKSSTMSELKPAKQGGGSGTSGGTMNKPVEPVQTQVPGSPCLFLYPSPRYLGYNGSDEELLTCPLPEEILVDIIAERIQLNDCHKGIIFDGLGNLYCPSLVNTVQIILKAFNNRRYILFVCLKLDYAIHQERERKKERDGSPDYYYSLGVPTRVVISDCSLTTTGGLPWNLDKNKREQDEKELKWIEEMSEEEYDSMCESQKAKVDKRLMVIKMERMKKERKERVEKDRKEKLEVAENRRHDEEKLVKKKSRRSQIVPLQHTGSSEKETKKNNVQSKVPPSCPDKMTKFELEPRTSFNERSESQVTDRSDMIDQDLKRKKSFKEQKRIITAIVKDKGKDTEEIFKETQKNDFNLMQRFNQFENSLKEIIEILEFWDRTSLQVRRPHSPSEKSEIEDHPPPSAKKGPRGKNEKGDKQSKESEKEKEKEREKEKEKERAAREAASQLLTNNETGVDGEEPEEGKCNSMYGVPYILIDCYTSDKPLMEQILKSEKLPQISEVLEGLGLGPKGPPIPPPAIFAVVPYPVKRRASATADISKHYTFIASSPDDPNVILEEKMKEPENEEVASLEKPERVTPVSKAKNTKVTEKVTEKPRSGLDSNKKKNVNKKKPNQVKSQFQVPSPPLCGVTPSSDDCQSITADNFAVSEPKMPKLNYFRWIVPANGEITLRIRFLSDELGQFDHTLTFEITGTRRRYQVFNRGVCTFPSISTDPKTVFPRCKKTKNPMDIVHKKYIFSSETFEFGPLLVGNCVDKYKEFQENIEFLNIVNTSPIETEVYFCFLQDNKRENFMLDPPSMTLAPDESKKLTIWACPRVPGHYFDAIICCIKENPETVIFRICCDGFRPELELDKKTFQFDKVLILREEMRTIYLRNCTQLPVAWKLIGTENIGEEFSVNVHSNVVEPLTEYPLHAYFCAKKPVMITKKMIKLEISDCDNIVKPVTEQINIVAEAYDVAVDISFPKGIASDDERCLDFGTVHVSEDSKQALTLKNKGRYDILYSIIPNPDLQDKSLMPLFTVTPMKGVLLPLDRPVTSYVVFNTDKERCIKDQTIFQCQVVDPTGGELVVANLPIKISVKAIFSKFVISPENDINFGFLMLTAKKSRTITIENKGEFEFKYSIGRMVREKDTTSKAKKLAEGTLGVRFTIGMFTIFPASGNVMPGCQQIINIECSADTVSICDEEFSIDITDRDLKLYPLGIPYRIQAECCVPSICIDDIGAIFEEHRICKSLSLWQHYNQIDSGGVYGEIEKKFMFTNVIVGKKSKARFKIINNTKVPCDVSLTLKTQSARIIGKGPHQVDAFEIEPSKAQILNHGHIFATVTFAPQAMEMYTTYFEAAVDIANMPFKIDPLVFEISGEGTLPRISITQPTIRNRKGQPVLLFKQTLVEHTHSLAMSLNNDGTLPCQIDLNLIDTDKVYTLLPTGDTNADMGYEVIDEKVIQKKTYTASLSLECGANASFEVLFQPKQPVKSYGQVQLCIHGNQYENTIIWLVGEGYLEEVTLDNIMLDPQLELQLKTESLDNCPDNENIQVTKANLMVFGDCYIREPKTQCLSITNRCQSDCIYFQWIEQFPLKFSPRMGNLMPGQAKEVTITFNADKPVCLKQQIIKCTIKKITFDQPLDEIPDWDDRIHVIQWMDVDPPAGTNTRSDSITALPANMITSKEKANMDSNARVSSQNKTGPTPAPSAVPAATPIVPSPRKKKVIKTKPQPPCNEVADSERTIVLLVSGIANYCEYLCPTSQIHFKDTLMFQTRTYKLSLTNKGVIQMDYNWQVVMDTFKTSAITNGLKSVDEEPSSRSSSPASSPDPYVPFSIEPAFGTIPAKGTGNFTVKFSPLNTTENSGYLICSIPNLKENIQGPSIGMKGRSLMPYCHFELEDSDYIRSRRNPELRGPGGAPPGSVLDVNTRSIEMECIGIGVKMQKKFYILNPTNMTYSYEWISEDETNPKNFTGFSCLTSKGSVKPGKRAEMCFEFRSIEIGISESFWIFQIPEQNISVPFLLVTHVKDPDVLLDRSHMKFKPVLINHKISEIVYLVNNEPKPFQFTFDEGSYFSGGIPSKLCIEPMKGILPPNSKLPITFTITPLNEKLINFNILCKVVGKLSHLQLNIKSEGYAMSCAILYEDIKGIMSELTKWGSDEMDFAEVEVNEKTTRMVKISNTGKFHFNFEWELNDKANQLVSVNPKSGSVKFGCKEQCIISFCPKNKVSLNGGRMKIKISNGPTYEILLAGRGVYPGLHFSFLSQNFGTCFIYKAGMKPKTAQLRITNKDTKEISLDCLYSNTNHLMHDFKRAVLTPGSMLDVNFSFYPRDAVKYKETVIFEVNGLSTKKVEFWGEGCEMKVTVVDCKHKIVKLGAQHIGSCIKKIVPIINRSLAPVTFNLLGLPASSQLKEGNIITLTPSETITLPAKTGKIDIHVVFKPIKRIQQFLEEIFIDAAGYSQPIFVIQGSCLALDIVLETNYIPFGAVVRQSHSTRKLVLNNIGDINARVRWDIDKFKPDFFINPVESHVIAGKQIVFDVTFMPPKVLPDIRYENLLCFVNEGEYPPLKLTLTGTCVSTPTSREVLYFQTYVRNKDTKSVSIANRTNQMWELHPIVDGNYWQGPHKFSVDPQSTKQYDITYQPMCMTGGDGKKHTGSILFPLPDGTVIFCSLIGIADPPKANDKISRDVPCKVHYTELLTVYNWSKQSMRFKIKTEILKPEKIEPSTTFKGMDYIDIPANDQKEYKLEFHAHKEGTTLIRVTFIHTESGEYQFYELTLRSTKAGSLGLIELSCPVRTSVPYTISVENPLTMAVTFNTNTNVPDLIVPNQVIIAPQSIRPVKLEYQPIRVGESSGKFEMTSPDLGLYLYDVRLKATPAAPERPVYFCTSFGLAVNQTAKFLNFCKQRSDYICKVSNTDFHVDKSITAASGSPSGTEVAVDVIFEPSRLGQQTSTLTMTSAIGGEYVFPLIGMCTPPKPQGPFVIRPGIPINIVFRNVFDTKTTFTFQVDNELFHLQKKNELIKPHKDYRLTVNFEGNDSSSKADVMGKLIISCPRVTGETTNVQWVYYLKGVTA